MTTALSPFHIINPAVTELSFVRACHLSGDPDANSQLCSVGNPQVVWGDAGLYPEDGLTQDWWGALQACQVPTVEMFT